MDKKSSTGPRIIRAGLQHFSRTSVSGIQRKQIGEILRNNLIQARPNIDENRFVPILQRQDMALSDMLRRSEATEKDSPSTPVESQQRGIRMHFYPGQPVDRAEKVAAGYAQERERRSDRDIAEPVESIEDIFEAFSNFVWAVKKVHGIKKLGAFVSELHILGHGGPGNIWIGSRRYDSKRLKSVRFGRGERYMMAGATIELEGCSVGYGEEGTAFLYQIGRIFFGGKSGTLKASVKSIISPGLARPVTYRYPGDFLEYVIQEPKSLRTNLYPEVMSEAELEQEIGLIRNWLAKTPETGVERTRLLGELQRLEDFVAG